MWGGSFSFFVVSLLGLAGSRLVACAASKWFMWA